jgi:hypothetical protein
VTRPTVSAVLLSHERMQELALVLDALSDLPVGEVLVVGDGSGEAAPVVAGYEKARLIEPRPGVQLGIAGRNVAAGEAKGDFLLMLDDDSHPLPGAIEAMLAAFEHQPNLGVVGGLVREIGATGDDAVSEHEPGSFDWWLRAGAGGEAGPAGFRAFFFPEGACMIRRDAFLAVGGFFEPYFLTLSELDLAARLLAAGWEIAYVPAAVFHHLKHLPPIGAGDGTRPGAAHAHTKAGLRLKIRNQIWYFWLRYPLSVAARRIPAYLAFDLLDCLHRGMPGAWAAGVRDAWRERDRVRGARAPLPRRVLRRAELNRGRMHLRLLVELPLTRLRASRARSLRARRRRAKVTSRSG